MFLLLRKIFFDGGNILSSTYEANKTLCYLGHEYKKIYSCPNNCILYGKEFMNATCYSVCKFSRWKLKKNSKEEKDGILAKVLWYILPIAIPQFKCLFQNHEHVKNLRWHDEERTNDGKLAIQ